MEFLLLIPASALICALAGRLSWKKVVLYCAGLFVCTGVAFGALLFLMGREKALSSYIRYTASTVSVVKRQISGPPEEPVE